ncbi:MAG: D-alanyl-D-alanine carboxypeptidase [Solirubrobacterales bacterium]|nr:D-alanyl-D-alanine carboxypeptidase [Solirubrobacterales bacterium]
MSTSPSPFLRPSNPSAQQAAHQRVIRRRRALAVTFAFLLAAIAVAGAVLGGGGRPDAQAVAPGAGGANPAAATAGQPANGPLTTPPGGGLVDLEIDAGDDAVEFDSRKPPKAGLLIDLDSGEVLWRRRAADVRPVASLTKMMTAMVAVQRLEADDDAKITEEVLAYSGSGVGVLPRGKRVPVEGLLYGLMLPSGNDAARALAIRATGSQRRFVAAMNAQAQAWGLSCTSFASVEGLSERNRSCAADLAAMGSRLLAEPRLAEIVGTRRAEVPFPIEGGRLFLNNNNPLLRSEYRGAIGVKTGYTREAGRSLVAAAERGDERLLVVLLDSYDPGRQAEQLLDRGFKARD